jgi:hypothetical protein
MSRRKYAPADAHGLLSDGKLIAFACDVMKNKAFAKADAQTKDALGMRVADYVRSPAERDAWPRRIAEVLRLPVNEFAAVMSAEPVKLSPIDKPDGRTRIVGVPTFRRRCISNVIKMILSMTGDHLLPPSVRAYRPRSKDAVRHTLLDAASAVERGRVRYWAKLDFSSYFSVMPWSCIETALLHYGYAPDFIAVVMAAVRCPLLKQNKRGKTISVPNDRGAQMGLAESATLANMLPFELDEHFASLAGQLLYVRYSDDIFIGGASRSDVVGAVRTVQRWCRKYGIALKGVSPDMNPATLVHDVKKTRIELLGAEIDANGEVRLPLTRLKDKLDEIRRRHDNLAIDGLVEGISRYGGGGGSHLFDLDDVHETIAGFLKHWSLDPRGARQAAALISKTFPMTPSPRSGGQGAVWIAQLCGIQADDGVEAMIPDVHEPSGPTDAGLHALTGRRRATGPRRVRSTERNAESERSPGLEPAWEEEPVEADVLYTEAAADLLMQDEEEDSCSLSYGEGDDDSLRDADGRKTNSFSSTSMDLGSPSLFEKDLSEINGVVDDPREEPPLPVEFENRVVHMVAERLRGPGGPRCIVGFGVVADGVLIGKAVLRILPGRPESATVRLMNSIISGSSSEVAFAMSDPMLVKMLLQGHRRFRAPILYSLVCDLHARAREFGVVVRIAGGVEPPRSLRRAVCEAVEDDATSPAA